MRKPKPRASFALGNQPFGVWSSKANFKRSDDLWATSYNLLPRGNRFLFLEKFLFVAVVNKIHENQVPPLPVNRSPHSTHPTSRASHHGLNAAGQSLCELRRW